eukprot:symbB.v1.2.010803.t1/scaffold712.1/size170421/2
MSSFGTSALIWCELGCAMMLRLTLVCGFIAHGSGGSWWWGNHTRSETPDVPAWRSWVDRKVPWFGETLDGLDARASQANEWLHSTSGIEGSEWGVWWLVDTMVGLFGWAIFGDAWDGVKVGFRRLLQLGAVLAACLAAHYAWAIAWPVVSFVIAIIMAIVWAIRLLVKLVGKLAITFQRACGGAPEAYGAEFYAWHREGYASESETEEIRCTSHQVRWHDGQGVRVLSEGACKNSGSECTHLLVEDQTEGETAFLCPSHASRYLLQRFSLKCCYQGCNHVSLSNDGGMQVCSAHKPQTRSRSTSKSRSREAPGGDQRGETVTEDVPENAEAIKSELKDVKRLLQEIQFAGKDAEGEDVENGTEDIGHRRKPRVTSRSPGRTPKSTIHKNLAKVGMLDSPGEPRFSLLEEFFDRFAEARPLGVGEEEIRNQLATKYDMNPEAVAQKLCDQALVEQAKGQKGLTKFIEKWREAVENVKDSEGPGSSWSVVGRSTSSSTRNQTAELANLVRSQTETTTHPAGSMKGLGKQTEELVFLMRACGQYDVKLCPGEHGQSLAQGLVSAQHGAATKLRNLGCRQKMTQRMAIALAGPYWGTHEKYAIGVADFIAFTDAELDAYAWETSRPKVVTETRPAPPTRLEEWEARVRRHIDMWCLVYGEEWRSVKTRAAHLLATWHTGAPHQWPLTVMMECWEELHWRFFEELKEVLRRLKNEAGRESMTLSEVKFHALMPDSSGQAWLQLPDTFDLENPTSWFATEVKPRIERRQDRALWKLTWEGAGRREKGLAHAGAREAEEPEKGGSFEALDTAVQMQLLRRGGLKRMRMDSKEKVTERIKAIRGAHAADKSAKIKDGVRRAGNGEEQKPASEELDGKAGSRGHRVKFDVPEELAEVDYTKAEAEMQELMKGPDTKWVNEVAKRILLWKLRAPGIPVLLAKKDVAGAFRLLWVSPQDVELFAGDVPWCPGEMSEKAEGASEEGKEMTIIYLVSSFGFSGSPGEWAIWGRSTEEFHRCHRPEMSRRDGSYGFESKILVDDNVLIEPWIGLRPWVSLETYEEGVRLLLGQSAVNAEKDKEEGDFRTQQTIWGIILDTESQEAHLPEQRVLKGAHLLAEECFDAGRKDVTLRQLQILRGIATGWASIVHGLKNELKAIDVFLGGTEPNGPVWPRVAAEDEDQEEKRTEEAWRDLWEVFEALRWLCSRSETWGTKFGGTLYDLLNARERLGCPGQWEETVIVTSDATPTTIGAVDWTNGLTTRATVDVLGPWVELLGEDEGDMKIHIAEFLSLVAFACEVAEHWKGRMIIYGGDNQLVRSWVNTRRSKVRACRLLIRVLNMLEMRYNVVVVCGWLRTYHNDMADFITRCCEEDYRKKVQERGWKHIELIGKVKQALEDSRQFGPCFLGWCEDEDRAEILKLKERRLQRQVPAGVEIAWEEIAVREFVEGNRFVKDFEAARKAVGRPPQSGAKVAVMGTLGPDESNASFKRMTGASNQDVVTEDVGKFVVRSATARPMATIVRSAKKESETMVWDRPFRVSLEPGIPRDRLLPQVVGHFWMKEGDERANLHGLGGPMRAKGGGREVLWIHDRCGPAGCIRRLSALEVWLCQGRSKEEWQELQGRGFKEERLLEEGCNGTGFHTASQLVLLAGAVMTEQLRLAETTKAGACQDEEGAESMAKLLTWLRKWRRGELGIEERRAGGEVREVTRLGDALWWEALKMEVQGEDESTGRWAGKRKGKLVKDAEAEGPGKIVNEVERKVPFTGDVGMHLEEWLEANLTGDLAESTEKMYKSAWGKWQAWSRRHAWESDLLSPTRNKLENEDRLLGFLAYVGWIGGSAATVKQWALFAVKAMHKRLGAGDPTEGMHRIWILANAMERKSDKKPRRLGVTPNMMKWLHEQLDERTQVGEFKVDCVMLKSAVTLAWFFMLRAKEYADSGGVDMGMIVRGCDVKLSKDGEDTKSGEDANELTLQFRKTKADQQSFGESKTCSGNWGAWTMPGGAHGEVPAGFAAEGGGGPESPSKQIHVALAEDWRSIGFVSGHGRDRDGQACREMVELYRTALSVGWRKNQGVQQADGKGHGTAALHVTTWMNSTRATLHRGGALLQPAYGGSWQRAMVQNGPLATTTA